MIVDEMGDLNLDLSQTRLVEHNAPGSYSKTLG